MEPLKPSKIKIIERIAIGATVLIWAGVLLMAVGLTMAYLDVRAEQQAIAQAESLSFVVVGAPTATASPTATWTNSPTPTPTLTLTPSPTSTPDYTITLAWSADPERLRYIRSSSSTPTSTPARETGSVETRPVETRPAETKPVKLPPLTLAPTATPFPIPTPGNVLPASVPPDRIVIPSINLDAPVVPIGWHIEEQGGQKISVWDSPDYAAGWHKTSAYPATSGNVVLNGHNNIRGEVFRYLIDLEPEAPILLYAGDAIYHYAVYEKHILKERGESAKVRYQNAQWIAPTEDERLTLVTCWPYTSNTHRLIIVAKPYTPDWPLSQ